MPASASPPDKILWTCLPNGVNQDAAGGPALRIAVLVSPRLGSFALFSDWPEIVPHLSFAVEIKKDPARPETFQESAKRVTLDRAAALDPKLWASLFPPATFVRPHDPASPARYADNIRNNNGIQTYGLRPVLNYVKNTYQGVDLTPHQLPPATHPVLARMATELGPIATNAAGAREAVVAALARAPRKTARTRIADLNLPGAAASLPQASLDFARLHAYHTRALSRARALPPSNEHVRPPPPTPPTLDFHQMVSSLGDYPLVLRRLGLIIDLEIPFTAAVPSDSQLRLIVSGGGLPAQDPQPWTAYLLTDVFVAKPALPAGPGALHGGVMDLTGTDDSHALDAANDFEIVQIDPDGPGQKLPILSARLLNLSAASPRGALVGPISGEAVGLPALRSAGLGLAKTDRHMAVENSINNAATWSQSGAPPPILHAEDLLRGYRVDILDDTQGDTWRSLCARVGTYKLRDGSILDVPADEGYVKAASTTSQYSPTGRPEDADPGSHLYMHESIFRWTGWSLCARRPGKAIQDQGAAEVANDAHPANPTGLSVNFRPAPGSLPRLRFGHSYRIRLRAVDLAGGGLKLEDPPAFVSNPVVYARFDPIHPPVVVPTDAASEGESVERLVIRSNYDKSAGQYASDPTVLRALDTLDGRRYAATNDRHLAPPKTSLQMAETHGVFDKFIGAGAADQVCDTGYNLALREAGTLADTSIVDVSTGVASIQVQGVKLVATGSSGQSVIHAEPQLHTPYLPDVIARGAALSGVPGAGPTLGGGVVTQTVSNTVPLTWGGSVVPGTPTNTVVVKVPFSGTWPDTQAFRLRIAERQGTVPHTAAGVSPDDYEETFPDTGQPNWDSVNRVLTVFLGKGQAARLRYSSYPDLADVLVSQTPTAVPQLGYLHWWISGRTFTQQQVLALAQFAAAGVNWQISPFRELVLVHAVQQPLFAPAIDPRNPSVDAHFGDTTVTLNFTALFNALSTGKLDLLAKWAEWVDDLIDDAPKKISGHAHVAELRLEPPLTATGGKANSKICGEKHLFGDTKFRSVNYFLRATTAFREYLPPAITADPKNITRDTPEDKFVTVKVPNRARPAAPKVLYVVPSFGWDPARPRQPIAPGAKLSSRRSGGGLRVYLDRPWYSSGDGELLGVVLRPAGEPATDDDPMKNLVTTWGRDVIFQTAAPPDSEGSIVSRVPPVLPVAPVPSPSPLPPLSPVPPLSHGPGPAVGNFHGFRHVSGHPSPSLDEMSKAVDVVGYEVQYDAHRKLWYADVQINPGGSYCPFIRLALARYQPDSVALAELSRVVLCDFAQLLPDRTVNTAASADGKVLQIDVTGFEPYETEVSLELKGRTLSLPQDGRNRIELAVEMRDPGNPDPDIGWLPAATAQIAGGRPRTQVVRVGAPPTLWTGTITMPEPIGSGKYRVVVKEFECYYDDSAEADDRQPDYNPTRGIANRLVYADTMDV